MKNAKILMMLAVFVTLACVSLRGSLWMKLPPDVGNTLTVVVGRLDRGYEGHCTVTSQK